MGLVVAGMLLPGCMQNPPVAGGASDTEVSAQVCGTATDLYGNPIADALVQLRPKVIVSEEDSTGEEVGSLLLAEDTTDSLGFYQLDSVEEGAYHLTVTVGDSLGTVQVCNVFDGEKVTLDPVLKPFGMVLGWLELPYEGAEVFARAKVQLLGTDMIVRPDTTGMFQISLPEGIHRLRLSVDSSFFDKVTVDVEVQPSQVKNIGIIRLALLPPPPPPCNNFECDSLFLRNFLDEAGHADLDIDDVATVKYGRISELNFRGISLSVPLAPLGQLNAVEKIDLGKTGTADSCRFIFSLWNLRELYLDSNAITGISHAFENALHLQVLDLSGNQLTGLPGKINYLMPGGKLDLSGNSLCNLPPELEGWADYWNPGWRETQVCD